jgi:hypothetical protein
VLGQAFLYKAAGAFKGHSPLLGKGPPRPAHTHSAPPVEPRRSTAAPLKMHVKAPSERFEEAMETWGKIAEKSVRR